MQNSSIPFVPFIMNLSREMSLLNQNVSKHQIRVAYIAGQLATYDNLSDYDFSDLFIAALTHDIGAFTDEDKENIMLNENFDVTEHTKYGSILMKNIGLPRISQLIEHHHDSLKTLSGLDEDIGRLTGILKLADYIDRSNIILAFHPNRNMALLHSIHANLGTSFTSNHYKLACQLFNAPSYLTQLSEINQNKYSLNFQLDKVDLSFSQDANLLSKVVMTLVDQKSKHTCSHSWRVARTAYKLGQLSDFDQNTCQNLLLSGNFHDLGKLSVPSSILDKPGGLDHDEFIIMKNHAQITHSFLENMGYLEIADIAGHHHERLDGSGYPFKLNAESLSANSKIMAISDLFGALIEDRPYRKAISDVKIHNELLSQAKNNKIDPTIVNIALAHYTELKSYANDFSDEFNKPLHL
jgi:HD-GYP domain-containing protein (c-di-GMP phosphodiesterase class II)